MITYGEAKKQLRKYANTAGSCNPEDLDLFVRKVLQYLLFSGEHGNERKFCFHAENGCLTLPQELETPLKVRIDGVVGQVWSRWFEYHSGVDLDKCDDVNRAMYEEPNRFPTVYDLPEQGAYIGALGTCNEAEDSHIIVKGLDTTGRTVYTVHKGEKIVGEYLSIKKGKLQTGSVLFGKITEVSKSKTNGYVNLLWVSSDKLNRGFLADYDPYETKPEYRRFKFVSPCKGVRKVSVIGRIKLKNYYADEDKIPFDNYLALDFAGQYINSNTNNDLQVAIAKDQQVQQLIEREGNYKKVNTGIPMDVMVAKSPGSIFRLHRSTRRIR